MCGDWRLRLLVRFYGFMEGYPRTSSALFQVTSPEEILGDGNGSMDACRVHDSRWRRNILPRDTEEDKMEWIIALIVVVIIVPLGMILWWVPRCDAIGIQKAKDRTGA